MTNTQRILLDSARQVLLAGDDIDGRYVLEAKLGEGGMGVVFRAKQLSTKRDVALKVMKLDNVDDTSVERFQQEIDIISKLSHPNIVRVFDTGRVPNKDMVFVVMELIEGVSVNEVLWYKHAEEEYYKCRTVVELALEIAYQMCAALTEPHEQGIIHRDIKPENILLVPRSDETMQVKLLDFGVARVLKSKKKMTDNRVPFVGTPHYMAPEQVACSQYDIRTDLYSLGVVLFELLSGSYPFDDDNLLALLLRKTQYDAPKLSTRMIGEFPYPEVLQLVDDLLARKVEDRPSSALDVRHRIEDIRDKHRFKRIRLNAKAYRQINEDYELGEDAYFEGLAGLFHPWLTLPSGKPLEEHKNPRAFEEPELPAEDEESMAPTNVVPAPEFEALINDMPPIAKEPVQHKIQSWQVDEEWTNSFDVNKLVRGVEEMQGMFQGPAEADAADETIEQAITTLYKSDELNDVLDSYANMSFEDEPQSIPMNIHHTPSPHSFDTQDKLFGDNGALTNVGDVRHVINDLKNEGMEFGAESLKEAAFAPLYQMEQPSDVLTSAEIPAHNGQPVTAKQLKSMNLPLAPTEREDGDSMADTQQVSAVDATLLDDEIEQDPFVPASFAQDSALSNGASSELSSGYDSNLPSALQDFENEWLSEADESTDGIDPFADTMTAQVDDLDLPALMTEDTDAQDEGTKPTLMVNMDNVSFEDQVTNKLPMYGHENFPSEPSAEINLPDALAPQFGSTPVDDSQPDPSGPQTFDASSLTESQATEEPLELDMDAVRKADEAQSLSRAQAPSVSNSALTATPATPLAPTTNPNTKLYIIIAVLLVIVTVMIIVVISQI